ncbi:MAG: 16S rRNA processing protein RimM [Balneolaceae bacterium]|nr:16S rRNA processing protein RimM [Balneolaceae bacterium]
MVAGAGTSPFTSIGFVAKSHGLKGELKIQTEAIAPEEFTKLDLVYLQNNRGDYYPCRISHVRSEGADGRFSFFVHFDHIADRSAAEALRGKSIYVEHNIAEQLQLILEAEASYIDFEVIDSNNQSKGLVIDELDNGAQIVIVVATTSGSLMIPVVDQFVESIDEASTTIRCRNLDLLED